MTNELTLSLPKNVFQELFDLLVFGHENREAVLLNWLKCLCRIDSTLEKDRVDSIIYKNNSRNLQKLRVFSKAVTHSNIP